MRKRETMLNSSSIAEPSAAEYVAKNQLQPADEPIHGWYRFILGYPPHLVREYLHRLNADAERDRVFDPFCGTATTPVEARLQGFSTISSDSNPVALLATRVKMAWDIDVAAVLRCLDDTLELAIACLRRVGLQPIPDGNHQLDLFTPLLSKGNAIADRHIAEQFHPDQLLPSSVATLIPKGFISPKPLMRVLAIRFAIEQAVAEDCIRDFMRLALAHMIVTKAGNIGFGPEIYCLPPREDTDVIGAFASTVERMLADIQTIRKNRPLPFPPAYMYQDDARSLSRLDHCPPIGIVITSPPYPNEKDYTRSTRLESVLLGLIQTKQELRALKANLLRSNSRNVFAGDNDDVYIRDIPAIVRIAEEVEERRLALGKTSGFERLYHRVVRLYFGGMYRHLAALFPKLRPGARCAYVVGDQMSFFRVHIRTAHLLADVAHSVGYEVEGIELWRTRRATVTRQNLAEHVLILRKPTTNRNATKHPRHYLHLTLAQKLT
ncbi:hypothetical protein [Chloroflexus sp.]|uniref:hypothetical protein n=1 Tax=Chloroflexus sp. TaxID=1904827 RepID=UPI00257FFF49|nr:hypothetical protein [Chloroflexus sp.]